MQNFEKLSTPAETLEIELAILQNPKYNLKVDYIGYQDYGTEIGGVHLYNLVQPHLPGYTYSDGGLPTFTFEGIKQLGLLGGLQ